MSERSPDFPDDVTAPERRKRLTKQEIQDLELAGGVEGGMQAGSAAGPAELDEKRGENSDQESHQAESRQS